MVEVIRLEQFADWLRDLRDSQARLRIAARIRRLELGNPGDVEPVGEGVSELKLDFGPGYRVYYLEHGELLVVLLCGGNKKSQTKDIKRAKLLAKEWKETLR